MTARFRIDVLGYLVAAEIREVLSGYGLSSHGEDIRIDEEAHPTAVVYWRAADRHGHVFGDTKAL
jgi:hypothetical protein